MKKKKLLRFAQRNPLSYDKPNSTISSVAELGLGVFQNISVTRFTH